MELRSTVDMDLVGAFMTQPEIWERCADDLADRWRPKFDNTEYLLAIHDKQLVGVLQVDGATSIEVNIHPYLLKKYRYLGREMLKEFFKIFLNTDYQKVTAQIPICYKQVFNFAKKMGFKLEGINRQSAIKQGQILDQWMIGITREEMYGRLSQ